ncbi:MAG: hypothetical protein ACFB14_08800 [Leptolyngbyaceae cyanobacterium]
MDKEAFRQELTELLRKHLDKTSFTLSDRTPDNGRLPLSIPSIRIEAWAHLGVTTETAWHLAVEAALVLQRAPVLAHKRDEGWCFRVPLYMVNPEDFELAITDEDAHGFGYSVEMSVKSFALVLKEYQEERAARDGVLDALKGELGVTES